MLIYQDSYSEMEQTPLVYQLPSSPTMPFSSQETNTSVKLESSSHKLEAQFSPSVFLVRLCLDWMMMRECNLSSRKHRYGAFQELLNRMTLCACLWVKVCRCILYVCVCLCVCVSHMHSVPKSLHAYPLVHSLTIFLIPQKSTLCTYCIM